MMVVVMVMTTANVNTTEDSPPEFVPESLRGFMTNSEWDELLSRADYLITSLESIEDSNTRQNVFELLKVLDKVHREKFIEVFIKNSDHQIIFLSTDEEIKDAKYYNIDPYINKYLLIDHNKEKKTSTIKEGYFNDK